jgi:hypothetical protein
VKLSRTRLLLVAIAAPVAMVAATAAPASATTAGAAVIQGAGTIDPPLGLDVPPNGHVFSFNGTATGAGLFCDTTLAGGSAPISADGSDLAGTVAEGAGLINVHVGACTWQGAYVRVGAAVVVALALPAATLATGVCGFVPGSLTPPVANYSVTCVAAIASTK